MSIFFYRSITDNLIFEKNDFQAIKSNKVTNFLGSFTM